MRLTTSIISRLLWCVCIFCSMNLFAKQTLPETSLKNFRTGEVISTSALQGKVLYLDFWASWCKPCKKSFPFMNELHNQYPADQFAIVAINMDEYPADAEKFLKEIPAEFTIYTNESNTLATSLELPGLPVAFVIGKDGEIKGRHIGFNDRKKSKKIQQIDYLLQQH